MFWNVLKWQLKLEKSHVQCDLFYSVQEYTPSPRNLFVVKAKLSEDSHYEKRTAVFYEGSTLYKMSLKSNQISILRMQILNIIFDFFNKNNHSLKITINFLFIRHLNLTVQIFCPCK